jgi:hypothetical protein
MVERTDREDLCPFAERSSPSDLYRDGGSQSLNFGHMCGIFPQCLSEHHGSRL